MSSNLKQFPILTTLILSFMLMHSCGNWGWESIDTDNEEKLNIFGVISVDDSLESFVVVHKTIDTAGPENVVVGRDTVYYDAWEYYDDELQQTVRDTFWYDTPWIRTLYESRFLVKDATVIISDGFQDHIFERAPSSPNSQDDYGLREPNIFDDPAIYRNVNGTFTPQPDTEYTLSVTTESGLAATGLVTTPPRPLIRESATPDTVSIFEKFDVNWAYGGDFVSTVATDYSSFTTTNYVCGIEQWSSLEAGDTTWVSDFPSWCVGYGTELDTNAVANMAIRVRFLDDNYHEYFLASGVAGTISNILLGEGGIATGYGIEGGFGVFGALSGTWTNRFATQ